MSSIYRVLCMSHDPAIAIDREWPTLNAAVGAARNPLDGFREHASCDLLVGRYSAALVEVICPGEHRTVEGGLHADATVAEIEWLRLLVWAYTNNVPDFRLPSCWTKDRLYRLRYELGATDPDEVPF